MRLLRTLDQYRVLTIEQMVRVGVASDRKGVGALAELLWRLQFIGRTEPNQPNIARLHWVSIKGARAAAAYDGTPLRGTDRVEDAESRETQHRIGLVELHIALQAWATTAGVEVVEYRSEFDPGPSAKSKASAIPCPSVSFPEGLAAGKFTYIPDGIALLRMPGSAAVHPLLIEFERGGKRNDLTEFYRSQIKRGVPGKLARMYAVSDTEDVETFLGVGERARFLIVFQNEDLPGLLDRWAVRAANGVEDPVWAWFFAQSLTQARADFGGPWHQLGGPPRPVF